MDKVLAEAMEYLAKKDVDSVTLHAEDLAGVREVQRKLLGLLGEPYKKYHNKPIWLYIGNLGYKVILFKVADEVIIGTPTDKVFHLNE